MDSTEIPIRSSGFTVDESKVFTNRLSESKVFKEYKTAFADCSQLSLTLQPILSSQLAISVDGEESQSVEDSFVRNGRSSNNEDHSGSSEFEYLFTNPRHAEVPISIGNKLIAFLQTEPVLRDKTTQDDLDKITGQLRFDWIDDIQLNRIRKAHAKTPVISNKQFDASIRILKVFAEHLALIGNTVMVNGQVRENWIVSRARKYVEDNYDHHLALAQAAKAGNASIRYFSKIFKKSTHMTFIDYLTRVRIEKSKTLLLNPEKRVSEIAFEVGFESISQFNRSFRKICGQTPTKYRKTVVENAC